MKPGPSSRNEADSIAAFLLACDEFANLLQVERIKQGQVSEGSWNLVEEILAVQNNRFGVRNRIKSFADEIAAIVERSGKDSLPIYSLAMSAEKDVGRFWDNYRKVEPLLRSINRSPATGTTSDDGKGKDDYLSDGIPNNGAETDVLNSRNSESKSSSGIDDGGWLKRYEYYVSQQKLAAAEYGNFDYKLRNFVLAAVENVTDTLAENDQMKFMEKQARFEASLLAANMLFNGLPADKKHQLNSVKVGTPRRNLWAFLNDVLRCIQAIEFSEFKPKKVLAELELNGFPYRPNEWFAIAEEIEAIDFDGIVSNSVTGGENEKQPEGRAVRRKNGKDDTEKSDTYETWRGFLLTHHNYGGDLNQEPATPTAIERKGICSKSMASRHFKERFEGFDAYKRLCNDPKHLELELKLLAGDQSLAGIGSLITDLQDANAMNPADMVDDG